MERTSIRFPKRELEKVDELVEDGIYPNRSEAVRAAVRMMDDPRRNQTDRRPPWKRARGDD